MVIPNGTRDALQELESLARKKGVKVRSSWFDPTNKNFRPDIIGRKGSPGDGGESGRLVLLNFFRRNKKRISVPWCNTGEPILPFKKLD